MVSIDVSRTTASLIQALRTQTGLTTDRAIAAAAKALITALTKKAGRPRLPSSQVHGKRRRLADETIASGAPPRGPAALSAKTNYQSSPGDGRAKTTEPPRDQAKVSSSQRWQRRGSTKPEVEPSTDQGIQGTLEFK